MDKDKFNKAIEINNKIEEYKDLLNLEPLNLKNYMKLLILK